MDVRQGPLLIANDPLATAAERCSIMRARPGETYTHGGPARPSLTAWQGYAPDPDGAAAELRFFYKAPDGWRDTLSGELWNNG